MKIKTNFNGKECIADDQSIPGSPPIGNGQTEAMAVACLIIRLLSENIPIDKNTLAINGVLYERAK